MFRILSELNKNQEHGGYLKSLNFTVTTFPARFPNYFPHIAIAIAPLSDIHLGPNQRLILIESESFNFITCDGQQVKVSNMVSSPFPASIWISSGGLFITISFTIWGILIFENSHKFVTPALTNKLAVYLQVCQILSGYILDNPNY